MSRFFLPSSTEETEIWSFYINATGQPNQQPSRVMVTVTGTAQEFQNFMQALDRACSAPTGTACTFDAVTSTGVPLRFVVDRSGPPVPGN